MNLKIAVFITLITNAYVTPVAANNFWKWVDSNGDTHYTQYPPEDQSVDIKKEGTHPGEVIAKKSDTTNTSKASSNFGLNSKSPVVKNDSAFCKQLASKRQQLDKGHSQPIVEQKPDGSYQPLDSTAIQGRIKHYNKLIIDHCQ